MTEENAWITNRFGGKLEALIRTPLRQAQGKPIGKFPAVIFVSGFGMDLHEYKNSNDEISKLLVEQGFLTLQFSFAGRGKSEGVYREMTLERQGVQVNDVIDWLIKHQNADINRIGIFAQSFGVPSTLSADLTNVKSICFNAGTYYPGKSLRQVFIEERDVKVDDDQDISLPRSDGSFTVVGKQFFPNIDAFDVTEHLSKLPQSVFLIHGDQDTKVSTEEVNNAFQLIKRRNKKLKIFAGGDHSIMDVPRPTREEFLRDVVNWFKRTLK